MLSKLGDKVGRSLRRGSLEVGGVDSESRINHHQLFAFGHGKLEQEVARGGEEVVDVLQSVVENGTAKFRCNDLEVELTESLLG